MVQSNSGEGSSSSASLEFSRILWNPKFHFFVHNDPTIFRIQNQINAF